MEHSVGDHIDRHYMISIEKDITQTIYKYFTLRIVSTITQTELRKALNGQYCEGENNEHRSRSVQGQTMKQEKECTVTNLYAEERMYSNNH